MKYDILWRYSQYVHFVTLLGVIGVLSWGVLNVLLGDNLEIFVESFGVIIGAVFAHMISSLMCLFVGVKNKKERGATDTGAEKMTLYSCGVGAVGGAAFLIVVTFFG